MQIDVGFEERYWYPEDGGVVWLAGYHVVAGAARHHAAALGRRAIRVRA